MYDTRTQNTFEVFQTLNNWEVEQLKREDDDVDEDPATISADFFQTRAIPVMQGFNGMTDYDVKKLLKSLVELLNGNQADLHIIQFVRGFEIIDNPEALSEEQKVIVE